MNLKINELHLRDMVERGEINLENLECKYGNAYGNRDTFAMQIFDEIENLIEDLGYNAEVIDKEWEQIKPNFISVRMTVVLNA